MEQIALTLNSFAPRGPIIATIEFDGGTSCNIPRLGFGDGYGSFRINGSGIYKLEFKRPMSSNAAEIATMSAAIRVAKENGATSLVIAGDSRIALKWADVYAGNRKATKLANVSESMRESLYELRACMVDIETVQTKWQPRLRSVETFGH